MDEKTNSNRIKAPDVARRAFDAVAAAQKVLTLVELNSIIQPSFENLGFNVFVGLSVLDPGAQPNLKVLFGQTHAGWETHYQKSGFDRHDAVIRQALQGSDPVFWSDLPKQRPLGPQEQRIYDEARGFGLKEGCLVPIHHLDGSMSAVALMGDRIVGDDPDTRAAAHLLAIHYGAVAKRLRREETQANAPAKTLTPRQIECLKWTRHGKSSSDIGTILGISAYVVDEHLQRACQKLGVRTRTQAAVEAALHGLFEL